METQAALLTPVVVVQMKSDNLGDLAPKSVRCCTNSRCYHYHNLSKERNSNLQLGEINCENIRIRKKGITRSYTLATMKSKEKNESQKLNYLATFIKKKHYSTIAS